jgi:predicted nucleic acid-binding protein
MIANVFVDTNVFLYALDRANLDKQAVAQSWRAELWRTRRGRISVQVLQEFYANVIRKWPAARDDARAEIRDLLAWRPIPIDADLIEEAWSVQDRYGLSFWDTLIVAAAKSSSCQYLLTEDLQAGQDLNGVIVVNPFHHSPSSFLG